jgi:hypothetical protein
MNAPLGWKIQLLVTGVLLTSAYFGFERSSPSHRFDTIPGVCYASKCRSTTQADRFSRLTGYPHGRPGWIRNHMRPLRCHGADLPSNMVWMDSASAHLQDKYEGDCARYIPFDTTVLDSNGRAIPQ